MRWGKEKPTNAFDLGERFKARKNNFRFTLSKCSEGWYLVVEHKKKDIRFNSLWDGHDGPRHWERIDEAKLFCETWVPGKGCLGKDVE